jgi:hypothetical protein
VLSFASRSASPAAALNVTASAGRTERAEEAGPRSSRNRPSAHNASPQPFSA